MTETTGKTCLPCCAGMPVPWPLTWRPGRWRAVVPVRPGRRGERPGTGSPPPQRVHRVAGAAAGAPPVLPPHPHLAAILVRAARGWLWRLRDRAEPNTIHGAATIRSLQVSCAVPCCRCCPVPVHPACVPCR
jgi:hypothetical protein